MKNKTHLIVMGKMYADWCDHCRRLTPEWQRMEEMAARQRMPMRIMFLKINEKEKDAMIPQVNQKYGVQLPQPDGYPTIFRFGPDRRVSYYGGERKAEPMMQWAINGGQTVGGKRTQHRYRRK